MEHLCENCGKVVGYKKFCSLQCYWESKKGKESPRRRDIESRFCEQCGTELSRRQNICGRPYCSKRCSGLARRGKPSPTKGMKRNLSDETRAFFSENGKRNLSGMSKEKKKEAHDKMVATRKARGSWNRPGTVINRTVYDRTPRKNEEHSFWKGEEATYSSKHHWVYRNYERTGVCEDCGITPKNRKGSNFGTHWHNIDKQYRRVRSEWVEVCQKCHIKRHKILDNN